MNEFMDKMNDYIRSNIESLEADKIKAEKQITKIVTNYSPKDIDKLSKWSEEVNKIDFAIMRLYMLIGGMYNVMNNPKK